jgi:hypothetical protein
MKHFFALALLVGFCLLINPCDSPAWAAQAADSGKAKQPPDKAQPPDKRLSDDIPALEEALKAAKAEAAARAAEKADAKADAKADGKADAKADGKTKDAAPAKEPAPAKPLTFYDKLVQQYMQSHLTELDASLKETRAHDAEMSADQKADIAYIRKAAGEYRPAWWKNTLSSKNITFTATIWGKAFKANFMPSEALGGEMSEPDENGRILTVVTWQPHLVNSAKPLEGEREEAHKLLECDEGEAIVWHELGHNYVAQSLPPDQVKKLYTEYRLLFSALQEFYADMTALYHCSPQGRKAVLMVRTPGLDWNEVNDPHCRAANAIGAWILAQVLAEPAKWPSFRLPAKLPKADVERRVILFMYRHLDTAYSLDEDRNFRESVASFMRTKGASVLKKKGTVTLNNNLDFKLMTAEDRELQTKRDAWVSAELTKGIAAGTIKALQPTTQDSKSSIKGKKWRIVIDEGGDE